MPLCCDVHTPHKSLTNNLCVFTSLNLSLLRSRLCSDRVLHTTMKQNTRETSAETTRVLSRDSPITKSPPMRPASRNTIRKTILPKKEITSLSRTLRRSTKSRRLNGSLPPQNEQNCDSSVAGVQRKHPSTSLTSNFSILHLLLVLAYRITQLGLCLYRPATYFLLNNFRASRTRSWSVVPLASLSVSVAWYCE